MNIFTLLLAAALMASPPDTTLITPNATPEARNVMRFLADSFGKVTLSGQMDLTWHDGTDMVARVREMTGKEPAVMGYDFMNYHRASIDGGSGLSQVEEAIAYWKRGGLVTFCWHWRDPSQETIAFYTKDTAFRIDLDNPETKARLLADIDSVALELRVLADAGVPVLWRPLHEASGGWFWWGASGPQPFIDLWKLMVERLRDHHGLTNLIWVYNGQHPDWYPGDAWVDIIGEDVYADVGLLTGPDVGSQVKRFNQARNTPGEPKIVALTENGILPDPDLMMRDGAMWSWFLTWNDGPDASNPRNFFSGEHWGTREHKIRVYNHPLVLTLDELPRFQALRD
jgi:mannan endo-1,4-beta-mannosidase